MFEVPNGLYNKTTLVVVSRPENGVTCKLVFEKIGVKPTIAYGVFEALKLAEQEMPYFVVAESVLPDGNAGNIFDKLRQNEFFKNLPIFAVVPQKIKKFIEPLVGRKFDGIYVGGYSEVSFAQKMQELCQTINSSPYCLNIRQTKLDKEIVVSCEATVIGKSKDCIVSQASIPVDSSANILCVPKEAKYSAAVLRAATVLDDKKNSGYFNLFPCSKIQGKGIKWMSELPEIDMQSGNESTSGGPKRILFFDPDKDRYDAFAKILKGYDYDLIYAKSLTVAASFLQQNFDRLHAIYLHELLNDATAITWSKQFNLLKPEQRPVMLIGTSSMNMRSVGKIQYIKRPFGLGPFLEKLEVLSENQEQFSKNIEAKKSNLVDVSVYYQAPARLLALDEMGGLIRLRFPLRSGSKLKVSNPFLKEIWSQDEITIVNSALEKGTTDWIMRFQSIGSGTSKSLYWKKLQDTVQKTGLLLDVSPAVIDAAAVGK
ncbi:MAG: hypothetical protein KBD78_11220 [Oligoflexales bacterium]|nr:hypothetical protein [Oligoflexales bacterium]